jgi:transcriptional regulator with XRE-family HTH domain
MPTRSSITADQVRYARSRSGLSQSQAARLVGLGSSHRWSDYETGRTTCPEQTYRLFCLLTRLEPLPPWPRTP